jgi:toxin ParE1/3/4
MEAETGCRSWQSRAARSNEAGSSAPSGAARSAGRGPVLPQGGGTRLAVTSVKATNEAVDQTELEPGLGSPRLGKLLNIAGFRICRVAGFPLRWCCFERADHLDVVRLLGERQDVAAILSNELASS